MEYIVLGKDGKEYGPVDGETLSKWVENGRVFKDTKIRNALMMKWNEAGKLDFLQSSFELQEVHEEEETATVGGKLKNLLGLGPEKHEATEEVQKATAYRQKYIPNPPNPIKRLAAFAIDGILISIFGIILFFIMVIYTGTWVTVETQAFEDISKMGETDGTAESVTPEEKGESIEIVSGDEVDNPTEAAPAEDEEEFDKEEEEKAEPIVWPAPAQLKRTYNFFFSIFALGVLLYYGISLGIYAQTYGMWYWGLIIVKGKNDEAFAGRAFAYAVASFLVGITTPIIVLVNPQHRSLQGYISGCRLISITAKSKT